MTLDQKVINLALAPSRLPPVSHAIGELFADKRAERRTQSAAGRTLLNAAEQVLALPQTACDAIGHQLAKGSLLLCSYIPPLHRAAQQQIQRQAQQASTQCLSHIEPAINSSIDALFDTFQVELRAQQIQTLAKRPKEHALALANKAATQLDQIVASPQEKIGSLVSRVASYTLGIYRQIGAWISLPSSFEKTLEPFTQKEHNKALMQQHVDALKQQGADKIKQATERYDALVQRYSSPQLRQDTKTRVMQQLQEKAIQPLLTQLFTEGALLVGTEALGFGYSCALYTGLYASVNAISQTIWSTHMDVSNGVWYGQQALNAYIFGPVVYKCAKTGAAIYAQRAKAAQIHAMLEPLKEGIEKTLVRYGLPQNSAPVVLNLCAALLAELPPVLLPLAQEKLQSIVTTLTQELIGCLPKLGDIA